MRSLKSLLICSCVLVLILAEAAQAYLDPGTGSLLFQMLLASLVGAVVAVKMFWYNIKRFLSGLFSKNRAKKKDDEQ